MTGYTGGLDRAVAVAAPGALRTRLVTLPMIALIGLAALAAVAGLAGLDGLGRS
jgi:hypothetical protein